MTRKQLRAAYNHAYSCWKLYRTRKWEARVKALNLALMQESTRRARGGGR